MRIDDKNTPGMGTSGLSGAQGASGAQGTSGAQGPSSVERQGGADVRGTGGSGTPDQVKLSGLAERLQELQPGSEAREAELSRLRELVQSGRYQVNSERVGEALLEESLKETAFEQSQAKPAPDRTARRRTQ